ncbi:MAG: pectate lyase, partial [Muribaculaceae bacterium]|nr:pectate lyase [Muribaculaceae bacterium]
ADTDFQVTIEGIGDDATLKGFGLGFVNGKGAEARNLAIMLHGSSNDNLEVKGTNHIWIHNNDFFYGQGGSGDHGKGDGSLDAKDDCTFATFSYNHFFDTGKSNLCGMKSEHVENMLVYHHNWFDHSDSRHPRVRTSTVHVYNNYYDGVAKYGIGATMGSSIFVESNYFRGTNRPMMSSLQGTDATGDGTFSGENGGIIKSFGNLFVERTGNFSYITYQENQLSFDAYEASSRDEQVPAEVKTLNGATSYNNFDTSASMFDYAPDAAAEVPSILNG